MPIDRMNAVPNSWFAVPRFIELLNPTEWGDCVSVRGVSARMRNALAREAGLYCGQWAYVTPMSRLCHGL